LILRTLGGVDRAGGDIFISADDLRVDQLARESLPLDGTRHVRLVNQLVVTVNADDARTPR